MFALDKVIIKSQKKLLNVFSSENDIEVVKKQFKSVSTQNEPITFQQAECIHVPYIPS